MSEKPVPSYEIAQAEVVRIAAKMQTLRRELDWLQGVHQRALVDAAAAYDREAALAKVRPEAEVRP